MGLNTDIQVNLVGTLSMPYELGVATARTCYSAKGIIFPGEVSKDDRAVALRDRIAESTLEAGHLTTRQHAHFVFAISGLSRQCIWSFLHSHPFYNSEQVSQRYVRVKRENFVIPPIKEGALALYKHTIDQQMEAYDRLIDALLPVLRADYEERFPGRRKEMAKWEGVLKKRAYEVARYVLGLGTKAYLYHTVSALTLLRYHRLANFFDTPWEQRDLIGKMVAAVKAVDPLFEKELRDPLPLQDTPEAKWMHHAQQSEWRNQESLIKEFDTELQGRVSKLVDASENSETVLAKSVRLALGKNTSQLGDRDAIELVLDPKQNRVLADTLNTSTLDRLSQTLKHVHFTFQKKISHTADSQDQRHRMVPASRPRLLLHYSGKPDYITPYGITQSAEAGEIYAQTIETSYQAVNNLLSEGVSPEFAFYLLPNAQSIRMISSGDLLSYHHKWKLRSCYNAQEEIFRATVDEIQQVHQRFPVLGEHLRAPCYLRLRAKMTPYCPEGDRFCGLPVWKYSISDYRRKSI